jgi:hypothetical protein
MDISRLKKVLAGVSVAATAFAGISSVAAAYSDVPAGVWYEEAVTALTQDGVLDTAQTRFRGADLANRAEFVKLLVEMNGGLLSTPPAVASFNDVAVGAWYYPYMEEAAKEQWVKGDGNCYGSHPCYARPAANINRAEAAALIVRAFALQGTGDAPRFVDNPTGQWYTDAIQAAADHCVLQGDDSTGRVRPNDNMNRAEMVVMLNRVDMGQTFGVDCGKGTVQTPAIKSVSPTSATKADVQFTVAADKAAAEMVSHYAVAGLTVSSAKLTSSDTVELTFSSAMTAGKDYTLTVTSMVSAAGATFSDSMDFTGYTNLPTSNGTLEVAVASKNPAGDSVPKGAVGVTMLSLDVTASCDDAVQIEEMTVLHEGFGDQGDIEGVYAAVDGSRVSRKRTIDSKDQTAQIHFKSPLVIPACKTVTVDLMADFASTATVSGEHNFAVELPSDFQGNAKQTTGNFPLRGNSFKVAAVTSGTLSVAYRSVSPDQIQVGDKEALVGKFEVSANSVEDQTLYSVTMEQNGSVHDGDVTNLKIRRSDGTVVTNVVASTKDDFATFVFNPPLTVLEGDKITLEVVGDIVGGANETVNMHFEEDGDVFSVGSLYGYGVNGQLYGSRVSLPAADDSHSVSIDAGQLTIEIDGPAQQTYTRDQNDVVLANVKITTGGDKLDIKKLFIAIQGNTSTGGTLAQHVANGTTADDISEVLTNVTLKSTTTGRSVSAVRLTDSADYGQTAGVGTFQVYRFDDLFVSGSETWQLKVDFNDNGTGKSPQGGDQFKIHICGEPSQKDTGANATGCTFGGLITGANTTAAAKAFQMVVEGQSTGDKVHDVRPGGTITGNAQRIADASLTVAVKANGTTDIAVKNSKNINLLRFEARAGEAKDLLLTKLIFASASGSLQNGQNYTLWADTDSDGKVDTILESGVTSQNSKVTFGKMTGGGFVIPKEKAVAFEVHSDIAASLTSNWLQLAFSTADTDYIEAEQVDRGTSLSGIKTNGTCSSACDIIVTTTPAEAYQLVSQGNLYISKDTTPVRNRQLLGGTANDAILRLNLHAENEDIDVYSLQLTSSGGIAGSVDSIDLYKDGATTSFASATVSGCGSDDVLNRFGEMTVTTFCAKMQNRQLVVPKGQDVKILAKPVIKTDVNGALSGENVQLFVTSQAVSNNASGSGAVRARGDQSSNNLVANDGNTTANGEVYVGRTSAATTNADISGSKNSTVLSKITSITNANPDANGTNVPTGVSDLGQFKIAAAPNSNSKFGLNKVVLSGVIFNVNATNVALDTTTFKFYNKSNSTATSSCTSMTSAGVALAGTASGSFVVECKGLGAGTTVNTTIDQGTDQTFVLQANVTNNKVSSSATSTLQVTLQNFDSNSRTTFGPGSTSSHFEWIDQDTGTAACGTGTTCTFLWIEYPDTTVKSTSYQS